MPDKTAYGKLTDRFLDMFTAQELRKFLRDYLGSDLVEQLPDPGAVSAAVYADSVIEKLRQRGQLGPELFAAWALERPGRADEIVALGAALLAASGVRDRPDIWPGIWLDKQPDTWLLIRVHPGRAAGPGLCWQAWRPPRTRWCWLRSAWVTACLVAIALTL
ncbi:MAG: hypothetical protein AAGC55_17465 [Myxococcota bacterium]